MFKENSDTRKVQSGENTYERAASVAKHRNKKLGKHVEGKEPVLVAWTRENKSWKSSTKK